MEIPDKDLADMTLGELNDILEKSMKKTGADYAKIKLDFITGKTLLIKLSNRDVDLDEVEEDE